jgi:8-oxo-dGTP pyrophosphatase MutT (NUDIX family)
VNLKPEIAVTAAITDSIGDYLLLKRAATKKLWPNKWTLPGGHVEAQDYLNMSPIPSPESNAMLYYHVLENALRREVAEEAGLKIKNIGFLTSIFVPEINTLVISMTAERASFDAPIINDESSEYGWFNLEEARHLDMIDGIYDELLLAERVITRITVPVIPTLIVRHIDAMEGIS